MKKISLIILLMTSMVVGTVHTAELQRAAVQSKSPQQQGFVVVGYDEQEDLTDALGDVHEALVERDLHVELPLAPATEILAVLSGEVDKDEKKEELRGKSPVQDVVFGVEKNKSEEDGASYSISTLRDCKHGFAGALLGGYVAALIQDSYGTRGGVIFSVLTSAAAVVAHSEKGDISLENKHLMCGFVSGTYVPLMGTVFFRRRR